MTKYSDIIKKCVREKEEHRKKLLSISYQLKAATKLADEDMELMHDHFLTLQFPALGLEIRTTIAAWTEWKKILTISKIEDADKSGPLWIFIADDEILEQLISGLYDDQK